MKNSTKFNMCGQSTLEYAAIIACIAAALLVMQTYIKRGISGKLRSTADQIGQQYDPGNTTSVITVTLNNDVTTIVQSEEDEEGDEARQKTTTTVTINSETEERSGLETVGAI